MNQPNHKPDPSAEDAADSRSKSGTRRIELSDPVSVPRAPRVPSLGWPTPVRTDQDHIPTQPENEIPSSSGPTLPAPSARGPADVQMPDEDEDRDTIPSPAPE